ncbi:uncharacterized protein znf512 [Gadus morhua]|uniref:Zinc finger protein 512 n=1 Tax=Gadus morhua TaxID=8049 RepID=A0A8C5AMS9_GADMO|nr:zinc finger protein 512 [Gadus morhua]
MDHSHIGGDMSPPYAPRKRKSGQAQPKGGVPCPVVTVVHRLPDRAFELSVLGHSKSDEAQDAHKMKRTYGRKRFEDPQGVPGGPLEYPTTSCSVMSSGPLANGSDMGSVAQPAARLPPRLVAKDAWPTAPEPGRMRPQPQAQPWNPSRERLSEAQSWAAGRERPQEQLWSSSRDRSGHPGQDQSWIPGRERGHTEQAWASGRERGPEQAWSSGRDRAQDQAWNPGREPGRDRPLSGNGQGWGAGRSQDQAWGSAARDRGEAQVWRPDLPLKKSQRVEVERNQPVITYQQAPENKTSGSDSVDVRDLQSNAEHNAARPSEEPRPLLPPSRKELPSYPPGSQEERWQLHIVAKGRVTCPKCKSVSRKTVEGLKKHMENCRLQPFSCPHCGKQLKSSTGMKYHVMADHSNLPSLDDSQGLDERAVKEKLRKILKRLGKLKCSREGCTSGFTSIMGYVYHMKKCGKQESELEKMLLNCSHCGKAYKSKAGLEYHLKSEHAPVPQQQEEEEEALKAQSEADPELTASGRVQRASAQVANFHLAEIAHNDLPKDWPKRKFQSDLVPDDKKLKYARPGLPAFSQEVLRKWKNEVKLQRKVQCPNQGCGCTYTSVSGLKAHLGLCTKGDFEAGKYRCLICGKEFNSESGVKYHINSVHSQEWFVTNKKASKKFEKYLRSRPKEMVHGVDQHIIEQYHQHHMNHHHLHHHHLQHHQQQHHHQHHQHDQQLQQIQHQPLQQPLQPLHHLQHQAHVLHALEHQQHHHHSHSVPQMEPQLSQEVQQQQQQPPPPLLHYTPLEPPAGSMWVEVERREVVAGGGPGAELTQVEMVSVDKPRPMDGGAGSGGSECKRREKAERGKAESRRKDCFAYGGGGGGGGGGVAVGGSSSSSSSSSSNTGSSSSESELEQQERQRQIDQWNLKRPGNMEVHHEAAKRQRNT